MGVRSYFRDLLFRLRHGRDQWQVRPTETGVELIKNGRVTGFMPWAEADEIAAFKKDMLSYTTTCLQLRSSSGNSVVAEELMPGFDDVETAISARYELAPAQWRSMLEQGPPFEEKAYVLWSRTMQPNEAG
jgi:hypothetical protein